MLGFHVCNINDLKIAHKNKYNVVQLFVNKQKNISEYKKELNTYNINCFVHASYTINLSAKWDKYSWSVHQFITEIKLAHQLGALGIVVHFGKQLELTKEEALNNMYTALLYVHEQTKDLNIIILLETPTGQGTEICYKLEDLSHFYKKINKNKKISQRFKICVDSCHIFVAGYDFRSKNMFELFLDTFEELIGIQNIGLIHLNDSKNELGSRIDRHENIGHGFIGLKPLKRFFTYFHSLGIPVILETPDIFDLKSFKIKKNNQNKKSKVNCHSSFLGTSYSSS